MISRIQKIKTLEQKIDSLKREASAELKKNNHTEEKRNRESWSGICSDIQ